MGLDNTIQLKTNNKELLKECPITEEIWYRNDWKIRSMLYELTNVDPFFDGPEIEFKSIEEFDKAISRLTDLYRKNFINKVIDNEDMQNIAYCYLNKLIDLVKLSTFLSCSKKYKIHKDYEIVWTDSY